MRTLLSRSLAAVGVQALFVCACAAQNCGDTLTTDTVLTQDIGPCPDSVEAFRIRGPMVLDLNGFSISGTGGIGIAIDGGSVTVKGSGTISGFSRAVTQLRPGPPGVRYVTINTVTLQYNTAGIYFVSPSSLRIVNNTIDGGGVGVAGIFATGGSRIKIKGNTIVNNAGVGIQLMNGTDLATIIQNDIDQNGIGLDVGTPIVVSNGMDLKILANRFFNNNSDGLRITRRSGIADVRAPTVQGNEFAGNGRSGANLIHPAADSPFDQYGPVEDNVAFNNGLDGIEVSGETAQHVERRGLNDAEGVYKIAQAFAVLGDQVSALRWLHASIGGGFFCYPYIQTDPLLENLRGTPDFQEALRPARERHERFKRNFF